MLLACAGTGIFPVADSALAQAPGARTGQPLKAVPIIPQKIRPVYLSSKSPSYDIAPNVRIFEDASKQMDMTYILRQFRSGEGKTAVDKIFAGYNNNAYWIVFGVFNGNRAKIQWILNLGNRMTGSIGVPDRVAVFSDEDPSKPLMLDGRLARYKHHLDGQERNAIPLTFEPGQPRIIGIYIEPAPGTPLVLDLKLEEPAVFSAAHEQVALQENTVRIGAAVICLAFLVFWINFKRAIPACLIAYLFMQYMIFRTTDELVPSGNNTSAEYIDWLYAGTALAALMLARLVLTGNDKTNKFRHVLTALSVAVAGLIATSALIDTLEGVVNTLLIRLAPIVIPGLITVIGAITILRSERPQAIPFTFAWAILAGGALLTEATASGISSYTVTGINFYWVCFILHLSFLSFSALRYLSISQAMQHHDAAEARRRREDEMELRKTKELADQNRLLGVLQREKELMADLRTREQERIQAMRRAKEAADQANKAKSDFLAVISHEIRTPMTGVMGMIRLLLDTPLDDKQKEYVRTIQYSGDALLTLLNDILDLSKVEEGKMTIENIDFDLGKLVESVVLLMSGRAEEKNIYLKAEVDPDTPLMLKGDPTRLRQIFLNLIGNAIKFTEKGGVTVIIKAHDKTSKKPRIYFGVKDSGIGISDEGQKKLFQPYQQAEASTARKFGGTGLGLSICKRLVEAMGSSIQIASKMGEGTVFYFILSLEYGEGEAETASEAQAAGVIPLKILVVDDNIINQRVVAGLLEKDNHKIVTVGSADAALNELKNVTFDVILMDMEMPQIDGVQATQMIRRLPDPEKSKVTIVAMTGNVGQDDIKRCRDAGMDDYVSKPVNPEALRKMLLQLGKRKYPNQKPVQPKAADAPPPAASAPAALPQQRPAAPPPAPATPAPTQAPAAAASPASPAAPPPAAETPAATPAAPQEPAQPAVDPAVFEQQKLFSTEMLGSLKGSLGKDQMDEMMDGLYQKTEELIAAAEKAVQDKDIKALVSSGHDVKGMTSNFGLTALSDLGARLERQAKENFAIDVLADIVKQLRPTYYDTRSLVDKWLKM